jgi:hypothetical protein
MSQRFMSKIIYDFPAQLRTRIGKNLPAVAAAWNAEKDRVLGVKGTRSNRSKPGEAPREQTGMLRRLTVAVAAASKPEIQIITTSVGKILNAGAGRLLARPFINRITRQAAKAMREALHKT